MFGSKYNTLAFCGCYIWDPAAYQRRYLPQVKLDSNTTILGVTSRTVLKQTFINNTNDALQQVKYIFPLYDGVSISEFTCTVGNRVIKGKVKERTEAKADYDKAISQGQTAGLLEQSQDAADVFTTSIGNVSKGETMIVEITYLGELKNDAETDGSRFTIPTAIAPRYGGQSNATFGATPSPSGGSISITVDVQLDKDSAIRGIQSSSHPIAVTMGRLSSDSEDDDIFENHQASATLTLGTTELDKDFVVVILAKGQDTPRALLETHPTLSNQKALMTTLVPKFNLPPGRPEIIFVVDRSGSMEGKMHLVVEAMKVFLKSLPVGVKFNIYSFGSSFSSLFDKSKTYDEQSLQVAMSHISDGTFQANYGGTEMLSPVEDILKKRYKDLSLEVMLLTDGEIWNQDALFQVVNKAALSNSRFFTLGVGHGASYSLIEGIARAGRGFSQWVNDGERIDKKLVRMLKGAMTPHIDYRLELVYSKSDSAGDDGFEIIESFDKSMKLTVDKISTPPKKKISLFSKEKSPSPDPKAGRYDHLPPVTAPNVLQIPYKIPDLYPHSRLSVYLLLSPEVSSQKLTAVWLKGSSEHGDLELEIAVQDIGQGDTIHKLAAKKAMQDLEEGRGWLNEAKSSDGQTLKSQHEGKWDLMVEREAVRLGTTFQVSGKYCSFVAIDDSKGTPSDDPTSELTDYQMGLMRLEQQNRSRKMMAPAVKMMARSAAPMMKSKRAMAAVPPPPPPGNSASFGFGSAPSSSTQRNVISAGLTGGGGLFSSQSLFGSSNVAAPAYNIAPAAAPGGSSPFGTATFGSSQTQAPRSSPPIAQQQSTFGSGFAPQQHQMFQTPSASVATAASETVSWGSAAQPDSDLANFDFDSFLQAPTDEEMEDASAVAPSTRNEKAQENGLDLMRRLIDLQSFSGSWQATDGVISILRLGASNGKDLKKPSELVNLVTSTGPLKSAQMTEEIAATICAIAWLEARVPDENDVWEMVVDKARSWLAISLKDPGSLEAAIKGVKAACQWEA